MDRKKSVFRFKIELLDVVPRVWRRIEVPASYNFYELHVAIQDAMGWQDYHLHAFRVREPGTDEELTLGFPYDDGYGSQTLAGWDHAIADVFSEENKLAIYEYDFGDGWEHQVSLEEVSARKPRTKYPRCVDGQRACPPEDCGGAGGYAEFLEVIDDPDHEEHESMMEWSGGEFDPAAFDPKQVKFDSPKRRLELALRDDDEF